MQKGRAAVQTYGGSKQEAVKIAFFAELDPKGEVFFKTEGQVGASTFAINITYSQEEIIEQITKLAKEVLGQQEKQLKAFAS